MAEISTNNVLDGITLALRAAYPRSQIETGRVEQGLTPPAFIVRLVLAEQAACNRNRRQRSARFDVLYFPQSEETDCFWVADGLLAALEVISLPSGDKLRGADMSFEIVDEVLHFYVSYRCGVYRTESEAPMEDLIFERKGET